MLDCPKNLEAKQLGQWLLTPFGGSIQCYQIAAFSKELRYSMGSWYARGWCGEF